ncbi:hypothetical protein TOT_020000683 [Theileria orientalis strain Shintoku]|uniref:Uncharacterized protein n=1 Tax=Theileria orientalis strain Shintoku TaxID=869250 RepID=J4CD30_THEOR|nr:hypothetical protein TOT_020000683 [Theileria orientalis strain Shintoku]BAM40427.1 hypothetical protein TOT_020000683 [Theileria orientalis strain Shintoku]|eukprot:XP_009690728.1 hypothetical protein TOT_020000683 [Theileria orientalis strain Shintoku]
MSENLRKSEPEEPEFMKPKPKTLEFMVPIEGNGRSIQRQCIKKIPEGKEIPKNKIAKPMGIKLIKRE